MTPLAKPKASTWQPCLPISGPIRPSNRYGEMLDTKLQAKLEAAANRLLAIAGFFDVEEEPVTEWFEDLFGQAEYTPVEAEAIGSHGHLRPTWTGQA